MALMTIRIDLWARVYVVRTMREDRERNSMVIDDGATETI